MPPHELHLTVLPNSAEDDARFQQWCEENGAKYVRIELPSGAEYPNQPMLGKWFTSYEAAMAWAKLSVHNLKIQNQLNACRVKVETITSQFDKTYMSKADQYWEYHLKIHFGDQQERDNLSMWLRDFERNSHLSRSALGVKPKEGTGFYNFVTLRLFDMTREEAENRLSRLADRLAEEGLRVVCVQKELCVYDSNKDLDSGWL